jgi:hypothetical protein
MSLDDTEAQALTSNPMNQDIARAKGSLTSQALDMLGAGRSYQPHYSEAFITPEQEE